ncbi:MAG: GAF domain-containing protein, partial [Caldilineaceae bacterium]|nr:GAF domain-containing protein [Caldilineaceae bacterium]
LELDTVSINSHVFTTRDSYYAADLAQEPLYYHYKDWDEETRAAYCAPLLARGEIWGTLYVAGDAKDSFDDEDRRFIDELAAHAAVALRSSKLLNAVISFQQRISEMRTLAEQFRQIWQELAALGYDVSGFFVALYDETSQMIHFPYVREKDALVADNDVRKAPGQLYGPRRLGDVRGLVEWVLYRRSSLLARDFRRSRHSLSIAHSQRADVISGVVAPMMRHGQIVGAVGLRSYDEGSVFTEYDRQFLEVVANHIAVILANAQRHSEEERQLQFRQRINQFQSRIVDALPIDAQARQIQFELQELGIDTSGFFMATYDETSQLITLHEVYEQGRRISDADRQPGQVHAPRRLGEHTGIIDWLIRNDSGLIKVDDFDAWYAREQIHSVFRQNLRCFMAAPMRRGDKLIGVIGLRGYAQPAMFDESHEEMLKSLADYMAIVVENAQKLSSALAEAQSSNAELKQRIAELQAVSTFQRQISTLDPFEQEITNIYEETEKAMRGVGMDTSHMYLALYNEETHVISFPLVYEQGHRLFTEDVNYDPSYAERQVGERQDLTNWLIVHRQPLLFHSAAEMAIWVAQHNDVERAPTRSRSWLGVPMQHQGNLVGVIGLRHFEEDNKFSERHQAMLETIASQAAIALENAKLYDAQHEELHRFEGLFQAIQTIAAAGVDTQVVLETILEQAVMATESSFGGIQIIEDDALNLVATWPTHALAGLQREVGSIVLDSASITARAVRANRYELVQDVALDPDYRPGIEGMGSELAVVLRRGGRDEGEPIGVLNVEHQAIEGLDHEDRKLLISLANLAVVVWENARQSEQLQRTNAVALMGAWGADIVHDVNNEVGAIRRALYVLRQRPDVADDVKEQLKEIDNYADSLGLPEPLSEAGEGNVVLALRNPPLIDAVIGGAARSLVGRFPHVVLEFQLGCPEVRVKMHEKWVRQLLHHLMRNAAKAMRPEQQQLRLQIRTQLVTSGHTEMVKIAVEDDGNGVPPHIERLLFKGPIPQRGALALHNGHVETREGRGLLLVRYVVELHGGVVRLAQNQSGVGACFHFTVPVAHMQEDTGEFMAILDSVKGSH